MPTNYPDSLDSFTNPTPANNLNSPGVVHTDQHSNANDAIEALERWVGISGSAEPASLEFRLNHVTGTMGPPGPTGSQGPAGPQGPTGSQGPAGNSILGVMGWDEGIPLGTGAIFNVRGENAIFSMSGTVLDLFITGSIRPEVEISSDDADIEGVNFLQQGADLAAPGVGHRVIYAKADGIYERDAAGVVTGPFGTVDPATIKLDDLGAPDDNTDLNASTAKHGLMQKYPGGTSTFLRADGTFSAPAPSANVGELLMQDGVTAPPIPLETEAQDDWIYEG